jgi:coenzyme F420-reducing hydrogenase beta subunit
MIKLVSVEAEGAHQSIRRARQKGMEAIKKAFKAASADDKKRTEKEVGGCITHIIGSTSPCTAKHDLCGACDTCTAALPTPLVTSFHTSSLAAAGVAPALG